MYREKTVGLVIPAFNEEILIGPTLEKVPELIDRVFVVDDCSTDTTCSIVEGLAEQDPRISLIRHEKNKGPGGAIISGYLASAKPRGWI